MAKVADAVDLIPIESQTKTIQQCFQQCLYEVPVFQRPYSWSEEQLVDFWDDVVLAQGDFFFGSTVTWVSVKRDLFNDTYSIIDGQQRLTTSAIILSVIRDGFQRVADEAEETSDAALAARNQAQTTQRYLIAVDDNGDSFPVLSRPEKMFWERIQQPNAIPSGAEWNRSAERIGEARSFFERMILDILKEKSGEAATDALKELRANVLKARVIQVELASEEDGFLIFETLNTRGADLRLTDLVKNLLIRGGASEPEDRKSIAARFDRLIDRVQQGRLSEDVPDRFIWQSWNSRRPALKEPELFKAITDLVGSDPSAHLKYLAELERDSTTYDFLEYEAVQVQALQTGVPAAFAVPEFVDSIRALAIFRVTVANSAILAISRKYAATNLMTKAQLIRAMRLIENFHFQFTALTTSGSTGGTRGRYNRFAVRLEEASTKQEVVDAVDDLEERLTSSLPIRERAEKAFVGLFYAPKLPLNQVQKARARKLFVAYVLMGFAKRHKLLPAGQNLTTWSIEHIKPQKDGGGNYRDAVYSIGNLTLLTEALNNELADDTLPEKLPELRKGSAYFDPTLESWISTGVQEPSNNDIEVRAAALAREALDTVWAL